MTDTLTIRSGALRLFPRSPKTQGMTRLSARVARSASFRRPKVTLPTLNFLKGGSDA